MPYLITLIESHATIVCDSTNYQRLLNINLCSLYFFMFHVKSCIGQSDRTAIRLAKI